MVNILSVKEKELKVFRNVNGNNKRYKTGHRNYMSSFNESNVIKNQGIARAKLRKFIKENNIENEYWLS